MKLKRVLLVVAGLVVALLLGAVGLVASAFWGNAPLPQGADLPGGARLVKDGMVALFALPAGGTSVAIVDCGNDPDARAVLAELARRGARPEDVKAIFLTHGHGDHTAGCHRFPAAEVMALAPDVRLAAGAEGSRGMLTRFFRNGPDKAVTVTRVVQDGETVRVGSLAVRVFAIPGHTDGSAAYLADGVLYLGDSAAHRKDGTFAGAPRPASNSVEQNHASLRALWRRLQEEKLEVQVIAPAHSAPLAGTEAFAAFARSGE
jgi:glyoxylase-like metal-dependent hydrolase (beta-lactamase superfamily II)